MLGLFCSSTDRSAIYVLNKKDDFFGYKRRLAPFGEDKSNGSRNLRLVTSLYRVKRVASHSNTLLNVNVNYRVALFRPVLKVPGCG